MPAVQFSAPIDPGQKPPFPHNHRPLLNLLFENRAPPVEMAGLAMKLKISLTKKNTLFIFLHILFYMEEILLDFSVIKSLRGKHGMTAEELAGKAGVTRATITKIEAGAGNPTIGTIEAIAAAFDLQPSELLCMAESETVETALPVSVKGDGYEGTRLRLKNLEVFLLRSGPGTSIAFDPTWHENTAETCIAISGCLKLHVGGKGIEIGPGEAVRYKALQDHSIEVQSKVEFLLIHHRLS